MARISKFEPAMRLAQRKWAPEDFVMPARDPQGQTARTWFNILPADERRVDVMHGSRRFPFKTIADVYRWCIHTGLDVLEQMEPIERSVQKQVDAMIGVLRDEEFHQEFQKFLEKSRQVITRHVVEGSVGEARRVIAMLLAQIREMPRGYWRTKYLKAIETEFGHHLQAGGNGNGPDISLAIFEDDDDND